MVRASFPASWIVGFYTYHGTVTAAKRWGGPHKAMQLTAALKSSFEAAFHALGLPAFYFSTAAVAAEGGAAYRPPALPCLFDSVHTEVVATVGPNASSKRIKLAAQFLAVARVSNDRGEIRLKTDRGEWVTEYTPRGKITVHVQPTEGGDRGE